MIVPGQSSPHTTPKVGVERWEERVATHATRSDHQLGEIERMLKLERMISGRNDYGKARPHQQREREPRLQCRPQWIDAECDHLLEFTEFVLAGLTVREERRTS